jgi:hypothetical protein
LNLQAFQKHRVTWKKGSKNNKPATGVSVFQKTA